MTVSQHSVGLCTEVSSPKLWERFYGHGAFHYVHVVVNSLGSDWLLAQEWLYQRTYIRPHSTLLVRVDMEEMTMTRYSTFPDLQNWSLTLRCNLMLHPGH